MDMDSTEEAELEQELETELMEELLEADGKVDEAEFAAEEAAYEGRPIQKRTERGLPSLRIGFAGAGGKRRLMKRQIVDEFGLEDLGFADSGEADDAQAEAIEEIIQEMEDEQAAQEAEEEMADEYEEMTSTSTSSYTKPTSSPKRPSSGLGSATLEGSSNVVPVYNGPITYAVPKTGYYCVGELHLSCEKSCAKSTSTGVVPVTLVNSKKRSVAHVEERQAEHAEYSGSVLFKNVFKGELPAAEYPKIGVSF